MSILDQLRSSGIVSSTKAESFTDKETQEKIDDMNNISDETTTSGGIDVGISGFKVDDEEKAQEMMSKMVEACMKMKEVYESLSGKQISELVCPQCSPNDQTGARANYPDLDNRDLSPQNPYHDKFQEY